MIITTHAIRRYRERVDPDATFDRLRFELSRSLKVPSRHAERIARDPRRRINHRRCHHRVSTRAVFVCIGTKCVTVLRLSWESFVERGERNVSLDNIIRIAEALGMSGTELLSEAGL